MKSFTTLFTFVFAAISMSAQVAVQPANTFSNTGKTDSVIRDKLLGLAMDNPAISNANAQIKAATAEYEKAKVSGLEAIRLTANINEFVVNGSPNASFFPKYNIGINLPLSLFGTTSSNKKIAAEKIKMAESDKLLRERALRRDVLIKFENYKEAKDLYELQRNITDGQLNNYRKAQKDYEDEVITDINEVDKEYRLYKDEQVKLRTTEKELNITIIELEELIGVRLDQVLKAIEESMR